MKDGYKNSTIDTRMEDTFCVSVYTGSYRMCGYTADTLSHMFWAVSRFYLGRNGVKCVAVSKIAKFFSQRYCGPIAEV